MLEQGKFLRPQRTPQQKIGKVLYTAVADNFAAMKRVDDILRDLAAGDWRDNLRRAILLARMESAARRRIADAGFADIVCHAASCENGELHLTVADSSACARLRQMQNSLLESLQEEFPALKNLRFGIQF